MVEAIIFIVVILVIAAAIDTILTARFGIMEVFHSLGADTPLNIFPGLAWYAATALIITVSGLALLAGFVVATALKELRRRR